MRWLKDLKLKYKLLISFLGLLIVPLSLFGQLTFYEVSDFLEEKLLFSASQSFTQASEFVSYKIDKIIKVSDSIAISREVKDILQMDVTTLTTYEHHEGLSRLNALIDSFNDDKDIEQISIYIKDVLVLSENERIGTITSATQQKWFSQIPGAGSRVFMVPPSFIPQSNSEQSVALSLARRITNSINYIDIIGYLRIDFNELTLREILHNANTIEGSLTYIRNRDDRIVSNTDMNLLERYQLPLADVERLLMVDEWLSTNLGGELCLARAKAIHDTDWTIITVIPTKSIFVEIEKVRQWMLIILLILIPVALVASGLITYQISKRLSRLSSKMKQVTENVFDAYHEEIDRKDEIGELASSYNYMIRRISTLAQEQYQSGQNIKNAELELLHAQINPHFLYNTMDMINWMTYENRGEDIRLVTRALSTFYKISLSKGAQMIPLCDELKHVSTYMQIQNMRLEASISFVVDCPTDLHAYLVPKITLQPIVENSVLHGILNKTIKTGTITIKVREIKNRLIILISDDGIGMSESLVAQLLQEESNIGYGIRNVRTRLMLTYHDKCHFAIKSQVGEGTTVTITI